MKILHVVPSFYPAVVYGGPIESVLRLCQYMASERNVVRVLTTNANGLEEVIDVNTNQESMFGANFNVRYCPRRFRHSVSPVLLKLLPSYIKWADVVHLTAVYSFPTMPTLLSCRLLKKPLVWSPRGAFQRWDGSRKIFGKKLWDFVCAGILPENIQMHVTSENEAASLGRFSRFKKSVIPNGIEIPEHPRRIPNDGVLRLLYLGRLDPKKGIENLLRACCDLRSFSNLKWTLTIAGSGEDSYVRKLKELIGELQISDFVVLVGEVTGDAKESVFSGADVVVVPSYAENFGIVVAESLSRGIPVIAAHGTPWSDLEQKGCGLWVENSPECLSQAILRISTLPLNELGRKGREWMQDEFLWTAMAERMLALYEEMIGLGSESKKQIKDKIA